MKEQSEDLSQYKKWGLSLLQLMGLIAIAGLVLNALLRVLF